MHLNFPGVSKVEISDVRRDSENSNKAYTIITIKAYSDLGYAEIKLFSRSGKDIVFVDKRKEK